MTLEEAIEEVKLRAVNGVYWPGAHGRAEVAEAILNAVASGQLVSKADADLAVAEALRKAGEACKLIADRFRSQINESSLADASYRLAEAEAADKCAVAALLALANPDHLAEVQALRKSYEELYADAMSDAESDARDFDGDLWVEVRKYLTELHLDWRDYQDDGITADQAVEYIRECMDEETRRAEAAEAEVARLKGLCDIKDALHDSAFQAGVKLGWNFGVMNDEAGFQAATTSTEHIAELKRARAALTPKGDTP